MKTINHQTSGRNIVFAIGLIIGWSMAALPALHATVIPLTGGDPGEGFTPTNGLMYAYRFYGGAPIGVAPNPGPVTIQGVTFQPFNLFAPPPGFTTPLTFGFTWSYNTGSTTPNIGASANDDALESMNTDGTRYFGHNSGFAPAPAIFTLTGLTPGNLYQVDLFSVFALVDAPTPTNPQDTRFIFNGGQTNHFAAAYNTYYDVRENVMANGSGNIVVELSSPDGGWYEGSDYNGIPRFNAFAVFEIPEPSAVLLIGLAGLLIWRRR